MSTTVETTPPDIHEVFDQNGDLRPGVQVVDAESGEVMEEGEKKFPASKLQKDDPLFLGDEYSGDYCELRDLLLQRSRHQIVKRSVLLSQTRLALLREHCWHVACYFERWRPVMLEVGMILTRVLTGDTETDLKEANDVVVPDAYEEGDDEGEEEPTTDNNKGKEAEEEAVGPWTNRPHPPPEASA